MLNHPAFPEERFHWAPFINVRLVYQNGRPSQSIECLVDSGAHVCIFSADLCSSLGIKRLEDGIRDQLAGIINGPIAPVYYHRLKIVIASEQFETMAGFSDQVAFGGILGRRGFFENFIVTIDSSTIPPFCEIHKIHRT